MCQKIAKGPDFLDNVQSNGFFINGNTVDGMFYHTGKFAVECQLGKIEGDATFKHPRTVNHIGACQCGYQSGECLLVAHLGV